MLMNACAVLTQPFKRRGQGTLGQSFPCLQEELADYVSWANTQKHLG